MTTALGNLLIVIPELPGDASVGTHHPISRGKNPKRYRPSDLKDVGEAHTRWVGFFEEILLGIFWKTGAPVPYVFKTANGSLRSLDAGCLKWLWNRKPPDVSFVVGQGGIIATVVPSPMLQAKYEDRRHELISLVSHKPPSRMGT